MPAGSVGIFKSGSESADSVKKRRTLTATGDKTVQRVADSVVLCCLLQ